MGFDRARRTKASRRRLRLAAFIAVLAAALLAACSRGLPQSSLEPAGPRAERIDTLFQVVFWIAAGVFVLVEGAIVYVSIRYRRRKGREDAPVQIHGNTRLEIIWTVVPALILAGLAFPTVSTIFDLSRQPRGENVLHVDVIGHQWWWEFQYPDLDIVTANELHIPVGTEVALTLQSKETPGGLAGFNDQGKPIPQNAIPVIHSFWVPRLSGKQDLVPGHVEHLSMAADEPGTYRGQCAEFCGTSHANMRLRVIAQTQADFEGWTATMQQPPAMPEPGSPAAKGAELFQNFGNGSCLACHSVDPALGGTVAPNLRGLAGRQTFAAGLFEVNEKNLRRWLENPRAMKPGVVMPDYGLDQEQIEAIVAYLLTLK
ncbi:MAG TPA: cytochrome c oxidase subunit II [Actinomycetota bacterium]|nr:cytochrome c oxidase subunit II [Actinomycetota bacterium]